MKIIQQGEEVGTVSFNPYGFEYTGEENFIRNILEGAAEYEEVDTGDINEDTEMTSEGFVPASTAKRRKLLKSRLETYNVEFSESSRLQNALTTGSIVTTPDGKGVVDEVITEVGEDESISGTDLDPSDESVYAVALVSGGMDFYPSSSVESSSFDVEQPEGQSEAIQSANSESRLRSILPFATNDWSMPDSWQESSKPSRLILLDAWASMGGQFDCGGGCCMGELNSERLCAAMKDEVLGTTKWRGGWVD